MGRTALRPPCPPPARHRSPGRCNPAGPAGCSRHDRPVFQTSAFPHERDTDTTRTDEAIVDAVQKIADARGVPIAQVAPAWVLNHPVVSAPLVGATKTRHLTDAVAALDLTLTEDEVAVLEDPYTPRLPTFF